MHICLKLKKLIRIHHTPTLQNKGCLLMRHLNIALWSWFSHDVLPVTCCEHTLCSNSAFFKIFHSNQYFIQLNAIYNPVKQVLRFSWQLFIYVPWQPVHSNSAISLATMKWVKITHFKALKFIFMWINMEKINQQACYNRIWSWSPMPCEKYGPRDSVDKNRGRTMIKSYNTSCNWSLSFEGNREIHRNI